jgi:hypothetical protein
MVCLQLKVAEHTIGIAGVLCRKRQPQVLTEACNFR